MDYSNILKNNILFKGIDETLINNLLKLSTIKVYKETDVIAFENNACESLGIILEGNISLYKSDQNGNINTVANLNQGDIFGEAILFNNYHKYPVNISSTSDAKIFYLSKSNILKLSANNETFINNYLKLLSNKILRLNENISINSYSLLREKIAYYLVKHRNDNIVELPFDREKFAHYLGVRRPSLSRELSNLKNDGIIDYKKNLILIKELDILKEML
ncbi:MAG: Crp/Fnr family transcriptional regulator [Clostridia bacterium]|jgi:CRP-like cAMP-binding protein|nr:Crp/Fnr family transcriptional regulator [Clostridia bacterium]